MKWLSPFLILFCTFIPSELLAAKMEFEKKLVELTSKPDQERVEVDFEFKVEGEGQAVIKTVDAPCSCLEAQISDDGKLVWKAGETGIVKGLFKVGRLRGTYDKDIWLVMSDGTKHQLTVRLTVPEILKIEPKTLKWYQGAEAKEQSFSIVVDSEEPLQILSVTGTKDEKFPFKMETVEEGKEYKLSVTPSNTEERGFGLIRIATDSKYKKHQSYQAYVVVTKQASKP